MAFTVTPRGAQSAAVARVNWMTAENGEQGCEVNAVDAGGA
jgi:hypothetical protein